MITNVTLPKNITDSDINVLSSYDVFSGLTNGASVVINLTDYHSPDTRSYTVSSNVNKYNAMIDITVDPNTEYLIDMWFYLDTFYSPLTWPSLTITCENGTIIGDSSSPNFSTALFTWIKKTYRVIPNYNVTSLKFNLKTNLGSLVNFNYLISDIELNELKLISNPVNNIIPITVTSDLDYLSSDIIFNLKNKNNNEYICENILTNVDSNKISNIDISPLLKNYIQLKWENSLTFSSSDINKIYESNNLSGIIPISFEVAEKLNGAIVSGITTDSSTLRLNFSQPFSDSNISVGSLVKRLTLPSITLSQSDNLKISYIYKTGNLIYAVRIKTTSDTNVTYSGILSGFGVFQLEGNIIDRQRTNFNSYEGFSVFRGSFNEYNWEDRNYLMNNYYNSILTTYPLNERKKYIAGDLELISIIQDPKDNIQIIYFPDNSSITNLDFVALNPNGVDNSKNLQLEIPFVLDSVTGNTNSIEIETINGDLIVKNVQYINPNLDCGYNLNISNPNIIDDSEYVKLFWVNILGGWESFYFKKRNIVSDTERDLYYKKGINPLYNGNTSYNGTIQNSIVLSTDILSRNLSLWMEGLFKSGNIYLYEKSQYNRHKLIPINIRNSNFTSINKSNPIRIYSFEIEYASITRVNL